MGCGEKWIKNFDLSSLRLLGTAGEPINREAWMWYYRVVGKSRCPIVDTYWSTESVSVAVGNNQLDKVFSYFHSISHFDFA